MNTKHPSKTTTPEPVVLQEGPIEQDGDGFEWCECGGSIRRGFDRLILDHVKLSWWCETCGRFWRTACAVIVAGSLREVSAAESEDFR